jgi:hypothetical protein
MMESGILRISVSPAPLAPELAIVWDKYASGSIERVFRCVVNE